MSDTGNHIKYSAADIEKYHRGHLSAPEMHAMEKAALDDPFLADAMEGFEKSTTAPDSIPNDIAGLQQRLAERVTGKQEARVVPFAWWKVAAAVFLFIGAGWLYLAINSNSKVQRIVENRQQNQATPVTTDSAVAINPSADTILVQDLAVNKKQGAGNLPPAAVEKEKTNSAAPSPSPEEAKTADEREEQSVAAAKDNAPVVSANKSSTVTKKNEQKLEPDTIASRADMAIAYRQTKKQAAARIINTDLSQKAGGVATEDDKVSQGQPGSNASGLSNTFTGTVVNEANQPMANATVQVPMLNVTTITDKQGYFSFKAPDTALKVSVASVGFETQNLDLTTGNSIENVNNIIRLKPSLLALNEVVVTGYGKQKKQDLQKTKEVIINILDAEPVVGWFDYNQYLENNKKLPEEVKNSHGEVIVTFVADNKSVLKNFKITKSLNSYADADALRLIKEGPAWKLLKGKKAKVFVTVKY